MVKIILSFFVVMSLFLTASCGFQPLYGKATHLDQRLSHIDVMVGQGRVNYLLGEALRRQLNTGEATPVYTLDLSTQKSFTGVGVTVDDVATRQDLQFSVHYRLKDQNGQVLDEGNVTSRASYDSIPGRAYAALSAEADAEERAAKDAARRLTWRLARFFRTKPDT